MTRANLFKITFFVVITLLVACSTKRVQNIEIGEREKSTLIYNLKQVQVKDTDQALQVCSNKIEYIKMFFKDSYDPYYGTKSISNHCRDMIQLEEKSMDEQGFSIISTFPTDKKGNIQCSEISQKTFLVFRYCEKQKVLYELWVSSDIQGEINIRGFSCEKNLQLR